MSHAHSEFELAPGLNVLIGPNNCGKSAVISALQTVCGDNDGDFMVRHGQRECYVTVQTDDGHEVTWRRMRTAVSFCIDGVDIARAGRGNIPDNLHLCLRMPKVQTAQGGDRFDVHFGMQKAPIFLFDSESGAAKFFSTSSDAEKLLDMQRRHKEKVRDAQKDQHRLLDKRQELEIDLDKLAPLDPLAQQLERAEEIHAEICQAQDQLEQLSQRIERLEMLQSSCDKLEASHRCLGSLGIPPAMAGTESLEALIDSLETETRKRDRVHEKDAVLVSLVPCPAMTDTAAISQAIPALEHLGNRAQRLAATCASLRPLHASPETEDPHPLSKAISSLERQHFLVTRLASKREVLQPLVDAPFLEDLELLKHVIVDLGQTLHKRDKCQAVARILLGAEEPCAVHDTVALSASIRQITLAEEMARRATTRYEVLSEMQGPPQPADGSLLTTHLKALAASTAAVREYEAQVQAVGQRVAEVQQQVKAWAAEQGECPLCGGVLDPSRVLSEGHAHG